MSLPELDNLVRIGQLKSEPANELEFKRLLKMAQSRLADARLASLSREGRFTSKNWGQKIGVRSQLFCHGGRSPAFGAGFQILVLNQCDRIF
jgi:hypothetical protein